MNNIEGNNTNRVLQFYIIVHIYYAKYTMAEKKTVYTILDDEYRERGKFRVFVGKKQQTPF